MTEEHVLEVLTRILRDLIGDDSIVLRMHTARADVPEWDSFRYVTFIVAVEAELSIKFSVADVESFSNVGEIVRAIQALRT